MQRHRDDCLAVLYPGHSCTCLVNMAEEIAREVPFVPAGPPIGRREDWHYVIESLIGGLETYEGVVKWLAIWPDLDSALIAARRLREGQVAT